MSNEPLLSVLMTAHNAENTIGTAIRSVLDQTMADFTFIIVDDGSTDNTLHVITSLQDERITVIRSHHRGRVHALNLGLQHCHGRFCAIADADDVSLQHRLAEQIRYMEEHPECGVLSSALELIDEDGGRLRIQLFPEIHEHIEESMPVYCSTPFPAAMFRRELAPGSSPFDTSLVVHDLEFWLRLLPQTRFHNLTEPLVQYRVSRGSLSRRKAEQTRTETHRLGKEYVEQRKELGTEARLSRLGRIEYYQGTMREARSIFFRLLKGSPTRLLYWRYFLPALLGDRLFTVVRRYRLSRLPGMISRRMMPQNSPSPP